MNDELNHTHIEPRAEHHERKPDSMRDAILHSIQAGTVNRKPKWQFVAQGAFAAIVVLLVLLAAVYMGSAAVFALRANGSWFLPSLGLSGISPFLRSLPWVLVILVIAFMLLLYLLVKRYAFAYGRPFLYSALAVVIVVTASAILVGMTSFHQEMFRRAHDHQLPFPANEFYLNFGNAPHDATVGTITAIGTTSWKITSADGLDYTIAITPNLPVPTNAMIGSEVIVLGARDDQTIDARAILPLIHSEYPMYQNASSGIAAPAMPMQQLMIPAQPIQ